MQSTWPAIAEEINVFGWFRKKEDEIRRRKKVTYTQAEEVEYRMRGLQEAVDRYTIEMRSKHDDLEDQAEKIRAMVKDLMPSWNDE